MKDQFWDEECPELPYTLASEDTRFRNVQKDSTAGVQVCKNSKDAGFIHEFFQNKTNRVIWNFFTKQIHEMNLSKINPQNESKKRMFQKRSTKQIHQTNLLKPVWIRESEA